ncbi:OppA family ABC transporter substrate-binding lipoprotein [Mycoplasmopsis fermentans]|uniref:OppA family ABC transporter substrate-binding lipoprotein n=1 Tax=Mycoplasmopsis fermentans TaxID=2115 RepID=UPI000F037FB2|nr:hypothetical protein [Mycoplasmopsis fermentans]RMX36001.1 hypothetical protein MFI1_0225 [Mycoplasmopsis fermentans MF-I1]
MNKKRRLLWSFAPLATLAAFAPVAISASCGRKGRVIPNLDLIKGQTNWSVVNSKYTEDSYTTDLSTTYGGFLNRLEEETGAYLLTTISFGNCKIVQVGPKGHERKFVKSPSYWRYSLEYADAVVVTKADGTEAVFDSDEAELKQTPEHPEDKAKNIPAHFDLANYHARSANARSVNSAEFEKALKGAKKIQLRVRKGAKWVDSLGNETKYDVVGDDFYISWLRTYTLSTGVRNSYLKGTKYEDKVAELDKLASGMLSKATKNFTNALRYPNQYLYGLYGVDSNKFKNRSEFLTEKDGREFINFTQLAGKEDITSFQDLLYKVATSKDFVAAPSQYIKETMNSPKISVWNGKNGSKSKSNLLSALSELPEDNLLRVAGVYTYGASEKDMLYAGRYFSAGYYPEASEYRFYKNRFYFDKDFVESEKNFGRVVTKYYSTTEDVFVAQIFDLYQKGKLHTLSFAQLNQQQQLDVTKNPQKYGLEYRQSLNKLNSPFKLLFNTIPYGKNFNADTKNRFLNVHAAKLFYGLTDNQVHNGTTQEETNEDLYVNMLSGRSVAFRSLLTAAVNWNAVANTLSNNKNKPWLAGVAPHGKIGGSDQDTTAAAKRSVDDYENLNTFYTVDSNGEIGITVTPTENATIANTASTTEEKYKSAKFNEVKAAIKKILDDYEATLPAGEKLEVEWTVPNRYINWNPSNMEKVFKSLESLIKSIDPRLKPSYKKFESSESDKAKWGDSLFGGSIAKIIGWGYDIDNIGSGIDGITNSGFIGALFSIGTSAKLQNKLQKAFPTLVQASKELVEFALKSENNFKFGFNLHDFNKIPTKFSNDLAKNLHHLKWDSKENKFVFDEKENFTMSSVISSQFFVSYVKKHTNAQVLTLTKEIMNYMGVVVDPAKTIANENFGPTLINSEYYEVPFAADNNLWLADIIVKNVK